MSLQFILGRAGTGKTTYCLDEIAKTLTENPLGPPIIFIVPDQMTFQMEYELANRLEHGMIRAQVYSFKRLSWKILQETGGLNYPHLSPLGVKMLLRKIVEQHQTKLKVYRNVSDQLGFYDQLSEMVVEFKRYCVDQDTLSQTIQQFEQRPEAKYRTMIEKLHDLQIIYDAFEKEIDQTYLDTENYLQLLASKLHQSAWLQEATVFLDGFDTFTPQEILVIEALMKHAQKMHIALTLDTNELGEVPSKLELFYRSKKTYTALLDLAEQANIEVDETLTFTTNYRHRDIPSLQHLEQNVYQIPMEKYGETPALSVWGCVNRRMEIESVAKEIQRCIREENYRFRDIALLVREDNAYFDLIEAIFKEYDIPVFIDQTRSMLHHPLIEFIRSSLEAVLHQWRYDSVFRAVKTDFFVPVEQFGKRKYFREKFNQLENFVLERGIYGRNWQNDEKWKLSFSGQQELEEYRAYIVQPLRYLEKKLKKATNAIEMCEAIYDYMNELDIVKKINMIRKEAYDHGEIELVREHDQVFKQLMDLFEQLVLVLPEQKMTVSFFEKVMEAGFESLRFALVPPAIDQVLVGNIDRSKFANVKALFILGVNDGVLPKKIDGEGILSDEERVMLTEENISLAPPRSEELLTESFVIYQTLTTPKSKLYLTYPLANEEGKAMLPSLLIGQLMEMFEALTEEIKLDDPELEKEDEELLTLVNERKALSTLASRFSQKKKGYPISDIWIDVYNEMLEQIPEQTYAILSSLFFENKEKPLSKQTSEHLYGKNLQASVTRLEMFGRCSFQQFANYGLRLKERKMYKLESMDMGSLFHDSLKDILEVWKVKEEKLDRLTEKQCMELAQEVVEKNAEKLQHQILYSSNRYKYIKRKLQQIVGRATNVLRQQGLKTGFIPQALELPFGKNECVPELAYPLKNGTTVELSGRIDRVDVAQLHDQYYMRIIDYKSGNRSFDLVEVYYGLALQMLVYLDVVVTHAEKLIGHSALPAGWFYFRLHNPMIKLSPPVNNEKLQEELLKEFKLKGMMIEDEAVIQLMDEGLDAGQQSFIVPLGIKKTGELTKNSATMTLHDYQILKQYTEQIILDYAEGITDGYIDIAPYRLKTKTPCTFCSFRSVCQFDSGMEHNEYRTLKTIKSEEQVLHRMKEKIEEGESNES